MPEQDDSKVSDSNRTGSWGPYEPKPIDNAAIILDPELNQFIETLARNNHELWAAARIAEGWRYGPCRDDSKRETPALIPYEALPESEKQYDRQNALETLKSVIHLGGTVHAPTARGAPGNDASSPFERQALDPNALSTLPEYRASGRQSNDEGESLVAFDIADKGLKLWPGDSALVQIKALALARMGSYELARSVLSTMALAPGADEEIEGTLARTFKDVWLRTGDVRDLRNAIDHYLKAYHDHPDHYWTGINAATLLWDLGEIEKAVNLAGRIARTCSERLATATDAKYWLTATMAEAALIKAASGIEGESGENLNQAERLYRDAAVLAGNNFGQVFTTWRNARIVLRRLPLSVAARIERVLRVPRVAIFTGQCTRKRERGTSRFPAELSSQVKAAIKNHLLRLNIGIGFSSATSCSDILFLEALQELGGKAWIVLPCSPEQFVQESVADCGDDWVARFNAVASEKNTIVTSDQHLILDSVALRFANDVLDGVATMRAAQYETQLIHMAAAWDGPGGNNDTSDVVARWRVKGYNVESVDINVDLSAQPMKPGVPEAPMALSVGSEVRAMIFADVKHFSQLPEQQVSTFLRDFMGPIAALSRNTVPAPLFQNTWGDGLFFVFVGVSEAALFALRLQERVGAIDRKGAGLPDDMSLRIALHAGPVLPFQDQLIDKTNYMGYHVNRTARMEPVTPAGRVYATELFAALATIDAPAQFRFDYVGKVPLAKNFGNFAMYDVSRI